MSKTILVRVAVAVSPDGQWVAYGDGRESQQQSRANALQCFSGPAQVYWLTAQVEAPSFEDEEATTAVAKDA